MQYVLDMHTLHLNYSSSHNLKPMKTFKVELSPKSWSTDQPHHVFMTIAECEDQDDCLSFLQHNHPALQLESIQEVPNDTT